MAGVIGLKTAKRTLRHTLYRIHDVRTLEWITWLDHPTGERSIRESQKKEIVVMATTDETAIAIARSILEDEGIDYSMGGSGLRKFGGSTFLGATLGPLMGQAMLKVAAPRAREAAEMLQGLSGAIKLDEDDRLPGASV